MQLINDLLNFSRYQNGLQKLTLEPCNIDDLLEQAQGRFLQRAHEQGIELLVEIQAPLPRLQADQPQLERVLDNLIDNALRHTSEKGQIRLQARRHGERVIVSVEDNGEGIAYGQQGRIFEPFVQVGRKKGGAGLGLALCKEIVQLHGGRMRVMAQGIDKGLVDFQAIHWQGLQIRQAAITGAKVVDQHLVPGVAQGLQVFPGDHHIDQAAFGDLKRDLPSRHSVQGQQT